jgi:hypothetical protein
MGAATGFGAEGCEPSTPKARSPAININGCMVIGVEVVYDCWTLGALGPYRIPTAVTVIGVRRIVRARLHDEAFARD